MNTTLRILILNYEFPPLGGGAGVACSALLNEYKKNPDLHIDLITSSENSFRRENVSENICIHYLNIHKSTQQHYQSLRDLLAYSWKSYWYAKGLMQEYPFDLSHAFFGIPCGAIGMLLGLPYIISLRGGDIPFHNPRFKWLDRFLFGRLSKTIWHRAKHVIVNSKGMQEEVRNIAPHLKTIIIHNGVDTHVFTPKTDQYSSYGSLKIVSVGRLIPLKNHEALLQSVGTMKNIHIQIAGGGPLENHLQILADALNCRTALLGNVPRHQLPNVLKNNDIFVLPSLNEGMPNAVLEAMACGLPIIMTDVGGSDELIDGNGFVIPKKDPAALASAIEQYVKKPYLLAKHGKRSREIAETMDWQSIADQYAELYDQVTA